MKTGYGCLLIAICVITAIIGVAKPIFFLVPVAIAVIAYKRTNIYKKVLEEYTASVNRELGAKNSERLLEIFNEISLKYHSNKTVLAVFKNTYDQFLSTVFSTDFSNKKDLLSFYKDNVDEAFLSSHTKIFINNIIEKVARVAQPTEAQFEHANNVLSYFDFDAEMQNDANKRLTILKKIADLHKNGLHPLDIHNPFTSKKDCFYCGKINVLKNRQKDGEKFFERDKSGEIYILNDEIDIIADGHKKIKMSEIISMDFADGILQLTILNRQTPLGLSSEEMEYIVEILNMI